MGGFLSKVLPFLGGSAFSKAGKDFLGGTPGKFQQKSLLRPSQEPLANQAIQAGIGPGAGGAFGDAADYYRSNLSNNPADFEAMAAPEMRNFNQNIIPQLSEQFAGMGSGGLSSSGFQNAAVGAGTDLSERLGALRAQLRQNSAQGLQGIGQQGLQQYSGNMYRPGTPGLIDNIGPGLGMAATAFGYPGVGQAASWLSSSLKGKSQPYGNQALQAANAGGWGMR